MSKIDVWEIASKIEKETVPQAQKEIENFVNSMNGKSLQPGEIIQEMIAPLIGKVNTANKEFTIRLIQDVVNELENTKK